MTPSFRTGQLRICPYFLEAIPRPAMVAAIVKHATRPPIDGEIRTQHEHAGKAFVIVTAACRSETRIELA